MRNDRKEINATWSRFCDQEIGGLEAYAITCVPPTSLTGSCNFDDLPPTEPVISRDCTSNPDTRRLGLFKATWSGAKFSLEAMKETTTTHYFSRRNFFSSGVKTSWVGTSVWCTMFTSKSASENSSNWYWVAIATVTCIIWENVWAVWNGDTPCERIELLPGNAMDRFLF